MNITTVQTHLPSQTNLASPLRAAPPSQHEQLEEQARKWVATTFYGTLLKQMHDDPFRSQLFDGGRGGQAFSTMLDQHLAERMTRGVGKKLVDSIVRKIEAGRAYAKQSAGAASARRSVLPTESKGSNASFGHRLPADANTRSPYGAPARRA